MERDKQWMNWLAGSGITKHVSLPPLSWLRRNCPMSSSNSERTYPTCHLYGPVSWLLGIRVPLLKREDIVGTHHGVPYGFTCVTMERI